MKEETNVILVNKEFELLKSKLDFLTKELEEIQSKTAAFETIIVSHISELLILEQELTILYKQLQKEKKAKRLAQKKKGKNYKKVEGIKSISKPKVISQNEIQEKKEKKQLYREAMLQVHPDKFSMNDEATTNIATEITAKLIQIYQNGTLEELKDYYTYIFSGNFLELKEQTKKQLVEKADNSYLKKQIEKLEIQLANAKSKQTYSVLTEYDDPLTFIEELKEYYNDRIFKLKKRTRKANKA